MFISLFLNWPLPWSIGPTLVSSLRFHLASPLQKLGKNTWLIWNFKILLSIMHGLTAPPLSSLFAPPIILFVNSSLRQLKFFSSSIQSTNGTHDDDNHSRFSAFSFRPMDGVDKEMVGFRNPQPQHQQHKPLNSPVRGSCVLDVDFSGYVPMSSPFDCCIDVFCAVGCPGTM